LVIDEKSLVHLKDLPLLHKAPFDRLLICQALQHNLVVATEDNAILAYPNLQFF
jgi:PIN domain nuclease of toxin-antitoxin system